MQFTSLAFAIFLPIVFVLYWSIPHKYRWGILFVASYYFYMSWNPKYVVLILFTTIVSYSAGILLEKETYTKGQKKWILVSSLILCLLPLFFFKYFNFFSQSVTDILQKLSLPVHSVTLKVLLPVGISFYTFQTISYVVDVYRGKTAAEHHFGIYATFISFFPQLVAGPIERTENLLPQIKKEAIFSYEDATYGLKLMAWGFFKKLCIADVVAVYIDEAYITLDACTGFDLAFAVFFFAIQIYCDFSGYSDIAIGTARLLGVRLMTNFSSPYFAASIREFWSRWHISLSTWFRDYVYIPMGGNRCSKWKQWRNLLVTFLVSGLWHGASWTYVIWGGIHGLAQIIEKLFPKEKRERVWTHALKVLFVFLFNCIAWVFFRAQSFGDACYVISHLAMSFANPSSFLERSLIITNQEILKVVMACFILVLYDFWSLKIDVIGWISKQKIVIRWGVYILFVFVILFLMPYRNNSEFIYFQF